MHTVTLLAMGGGQFKSVVQFRNSLYNSVQECKNFFADITFEMCGTNAEPLSKRPLVVMQ